MATTSIAAPALLPKNPIPTVTEVAGASGSATPSNDRVDASDNDDDESETGTEASMEESAFHDDRNSFVYATELNKDICTANEAKELRDRLHKIGPDQFIFETLSRGVITVRKLCTAFGVDLPPTLRSDETNYYQLLGPLIRRELQNRVCLPQFKTIDDAAKLLRDSRNIVVITGAGISTSLGIPDFRSKHTGFYSKLQELGYNAPEEVFDLAHFDENPATFFELARDILPPTDASTPTHRFIKKLQNKNKLLTNYTQNIDNIESCVRIRPERLVQCHGSWATATCRKCKYKAVKGTDIFDDVKNQRIARCPRCVEDLAAQAQHRPGVKRKRSSNSGSKSRKRKSDSDSEDDGRYDIPEPGVMKPDITFFGEALPERFFRRIDRDRNGHSNRTNEFVKPQTAGKVQFKGVKPNGTGELDDDDPDDDDDDGDEPEYDQQPTNKNGEKQVPSGPVDLIIVIGTSMKVAPVSEIPNYIPAHVPQIYISRDPIGHINFDINLIGDCDPVVAELCRRAGYKLKHDMLPEDLEVEVKLLDEEHGNTWSVQRTTTSTASSTSKVAVKSESIKSVSH